MIYKLCIILSLFFINSYAQNDEDILPKPLSGDMTLLNTCLGQPRDNEPYPNNKAFCLWDIYNKCTKEIGDGSVENHKCFLREYAVWDVKLNQYYQNKLSKFSDRLKEKDLTDFERESYQAGYGYLKNAQRAWLKYREDACAAVAGEYIGGSGLSNAMRMCFTEITAQRALMLKN